ncbi:acyl-CoA dehydrogenase family protein [Pseudonocardia sp. RS010]|uniref:acyl-CoA dehydrogenase family protein n=1 Tax=Pseudonocardia sp. RS010 TaxID=3385979 RepID=UPI00399FF197
MTTLENRPFTRFTTIPTTPDEWLARAREVRTILAADAGARDRAGAWPYAEVQLLKDAGLVTLLGPAEHGGGGQEWPLAYRVIREVAAGDGSVGQLLGYHLLWFWAARLVDTREQIEAVEAEATRNRWFFGGAVNPRDEDVVIRDAGHHLVYDGRKSFSTGSRVSMSRCWRACSTAPTPTSSRSCRAGSPASLPRRLGRHRPAAHGERQRHDLRGPGAVGAGRGLPRQGVRAAGLQHARRPDDPARVRQLPPGHRARRPR